MILRLSGMINITVKELRFIMSIVVDNVISFNFQFISTGLSYDEHIMDS